MPALAMFTVLSLLGTRTYRVQGGARFVLLLPVARECTSAVA
ncbi:hypothetical protein CYFUS_004155 [Cystobacter fuscus]|uniref:Uncharacterized protein n=1 Tax=Cystobacter fuscus TaxID=43 RepID=A0A250J593_9BACT|nr:hypothetical protein [Cystobacter fuscus]ATB38720.1 hypothetical protein CYFUS_004155 [Cystobacter fuscus]